MKPTKLETKGASPGATEISENVWSIELMFTNPLANDTMDDETKGDAR